MRAWLPLCAVAALAACDPQLPDSGAGVGFGDYDSYKARQQRDTALATAPHRSAGAPGAPVASSQSSPSAEAPAATGAPTAAEIDAALGRTPAAATAPVITPAASTRTEAVSGGNHADISDEQSFSAVSSRESIESDAQRIARQRAEYQQAPVKALPPRPQNTGPNLADYALSTTNQPGEQIYRRGFTSQRKHDRACRGQPSDALAQQAFLSAGGPQKDRLGMDPDGDGFACNWDPRPFRAAKG